MRLASVKARHHTGPDNGKALIMGKAGGAYSRVVVSTETPQNVTKASIKILMNTYRRVLANMFLLFVLFACFVFVSFL